jgi:hypothetical protein
MAGDSSQTPFIKKAVEYFFSFGTAGELAPRAFSAGNSRCHLQA